MSAAGKGVGEGGARRGRRTGRRPGPGDSRERILAAARERFAEHGYGGATMRGIAAEAGVDAALVVHFFGSKAALLHAAVEWPFDPEVEMPKLLADGRRQVGRNLVRLFVTTWDEEGRRDPILTLIDAATSEPQAATMMREFLRDRLFAPLVDRLDVDRPALRGQLAGSQLIGLGLTRYLLRLEPLAEADPDELVEWVGPTLQRYLTGKLG
jgi:AcrR family transcriptional regulator